MDDELVQRIVARPEETARIDERERGAQPLGRLGLRVARGPGNGRDNGASASP